MKPFTYPTSPMLGVFACAFLAAVGSLSMNAAAQTASTDIPAALATALPATPANSSLALSDLIVMATSGHPVVTAARLGVKAAQADADAAQWQRFPSLSIQSSSPTLNSGKGGTALALTQPLWTAGRLTGQIAQAEDNRDAARAKVEETRLEQALKVIAAWQSIVSAQQREQVMISGVGRLSELTAMMQRRVQAEISPRSELDLLEARSQQAQVDLAQVRNEQQTSRNRLSQLIGEPLTGAVTADLNVPMDSPELRVSLIGPLPQHILDHVLQNHPSMRRLDLEASAARHGAKVRQADQWPQLMAKLERGNPAVAGDPGSRLSVNLQYLPGAGFSSIAAARGAEARAEGSRYAVDAMRRDLTDLVSADWLELQVQRRRIEGLRAGMDFNRSVQESYERQFVAGRRTWLDVLNALRETQQSALSDIDARCAAAAAYERLKLRAGTLPALNDPE